MSNPKEITPLSQNRENPQRIFSRVSENPFFRRIKRFFDDENKPEILLNNSELVPKLEILYQVITENGEKTIKLGSDQFCRIFINKKNDALEFRVGDFEQVKFGNFNSLTRLNALIQVQFDLNGNLLSAVLGDLLKQSSSALGAGEYDHFGTVFAQIQYERKTDEIGTLSEGAPVSIPLTDSMKESALQEIFEPINHIVREQTQGLTRKKRESQPLFPKIVEYKPEEDPETEKDD